MKKNSTSGFLESSGYFELLKKLSLTSENIWYPWTEKTCLNKYTFGEKRKSSLTGLYELVHLGMPSPINLFSKELVENLLELKICQIDVDNKILSKGQYQIAMFSDSPIVANRDYGIRKDEVHLGDDSFRYAAFIRNLSLQGKVLEIGCGSGVAMCAALQTARYACGIDILETACEAAKLTMQINNLGDVSEITQCDFNETIIDSGIDHVIANLPGVPIPIDINYPTAGDGGPNGLKHIKNFWEWFLNNSSGQSLSMRFQSTGTKEQPDALEHIKMFMDKGYQVEIVADAVVPIEIRDRLSAYRVATLENITVDSAYVSLSQDHKKQGYKNYYCLTLHALKSENPAIIYKNECFSIDINRAFDINSGKIKNSLIQLKFNRLLNILPDEFWALNGSFAVSVIVDNIDIAIGYIARGFTPLEIADMLTQKCNALSIEVENLSLAVATYILAISIEEIETQESKS